MGSTSRLIRAGLAVAVNVFVLMTSSQVILDDKLFFCNSTANITSDCCLPCDINATCNNTCPEGQLTLNFTQRFPTCVFSNDTDTNSTSFEDTSRDFLVVCVEACPVKYYSEGSRCEKCNDVCETCIGPGIKQNCTCLLRYNDECVETCREGFYNDSGNCIKCDDACKRCSASGRGVDICDCKFEFNGTCFDTCYPNMTDCDIEEDDENNLTIIIAASVGGAAAAIIIVVVIVIIKCCRHRKGNGKSRMSTIIENRDAVKDEAEEMGIQLPMQVRGKKPGKYENVQVLGGAVSAQAQDTQDKMTRYAKDPTLPRGERLKDQQTNASNRESTLYENAESIKLNRNLMKSEDSNTKLKRGVLSKLKQSVKNRKSKKKGGSSRSNSGMSNPVLNDAVSSTDDEYLDMSGKKMEEPEQEEYVQINAAMDMEPQDDYENFQNTSKINTADEPQDDYENFRNTSRISHIDDEPQDEYENFGMASKAEKTDDEPQDDYENFGNTSEVHVINDEPQEEYENFRPASPSKEESPYVNVQHFRKET